MKPQSSIPEPACSQNWFAVFTQCHHERRVARQLEQFDIEHFLPVYPKVSQWKDRVVRLEMPLFPSYLFVHIAPSQAKQVLRARGTVKLVSFGSKPTVIPRSEIECLQLAVRNYPTEPADYLMVGERVRIEGGPLRGIAGTLVRKLGKARVAIAVETIRRAFMVEVEASILSRLESAPLRTRPAQVIACA